MRLPLALLLAAAACSAPPDPGPIGLPPAEPSAEPPPGGLTAGEEARLRGLGLPVLVPGDVRGFSLAALEAAPGDARLAYRRADGACFEVTSTAGGLDAPDWPLVSTEARVASLGRTVRVYEAADDPAATSARVWGLGAVVSEVVELDGAAALFWSAPGEGCRPVSLAEGVALVAGLRLLPTGGAEADLGPFAPADDVPAATGPTPAAAAEAVARRYDADRVEARVLSASAVEATALVTAYGLRDDSVRDERLRLTLLPADGGWRVVGAARQVRCWPGRGPEAWGPGRCV